MLIFFAMQEVAALVRNWPTSNYVKIGILFRYFITLILGLRDL